MITKGRNIDPVLFGHLKDRLIGPCRDFLSINRQFHHFMIASSLKSEIPACGRQANIEIRNKSKIQIFNFQNQKVLNFVLWSFDFVSNFVFRASKLKILITPQRVRYART
jgi:hypothetical protein